MHLRVFHVLRIVHVRRRVADQKHDAANFRALRPGELVDADMQRLVDALGPVAAAARSQLQQIGVEVLDVGGERERLGDIFVADVAVGHQAHADFGVGIGIDDRGGDRPDLALGALDQRPHRAGGVEHEGDFDHGLARGDGGGGLGHPSQWQHKKSESRSPRAHGKHEFTPLVEESQSGKISLAIASAAGRNCGRPSADLWRIWFAVLRPCAICRGRLKRDMKRPMKLVATPLEMPVDGRQSETALTNCARHRAAFACARLLRGERIAAAVRPPRRSGGARWRRRNLDRRDQVIGRGLSRRSEVAGLPRRIATGCSLPPAWRCRARFSRPTPD